MNDKHRKVLKDHWSYLRRELEPNRVLSHMVNVLDESDAQEINAQVTREAQVDRMLEILPRRGPKAFESFISALQEGPQDYIACLLIKETELEEMRTELHTVRCKSAKLREELSTERNNKQKTGNELKEVTSMHQVLLKESNDERKSFESEIEQLKSDNAALKTELDQQKKEKQKNSSKIKRLQELYDNVHEQLKRNKKDIDKLKTNSEVNNNEQRSERTKSTGGRKKHPREESMPMSTGTEQQMTVHYPDSDENKELVTGESVKNEHELVEGQNGTALDSKQEMDELFSKTLKEKEEAMRRCSELESLLHNAQARGLEMRQGSLSDRTTSFGDAPWEITSQSEEYLECTKFRETEEMCTSLTAEKDELGQGQKKLEEQLGQASKSMIELKEKHHKEKEILELDIKSLRGDVERITRERVAHEVTNEQHLREVKELSKKIERDNIELNRLRMEGERERAKAEQYSEMNVEKEQLKNKLEQEVKASKKEASDLSAVLESEGEERKLMEQKIELSKKIERDNNIELKRLREREIAKANKQYSELNVEKEQLKNKLEQEVKASKKEASELTAVLESEREERKLMDQKIELSKKIERDNIELKRLRERERAKANKQYSELNVEKEQLKNKLEQEVKANKKEASELTAVLEESEKEQRKLEDEASKLKQKLAGDHDTISLLNEEISRRKTLPGRVFNFKKDFDRNGVIYAFGTNFGTSTWRNPASASASPLHITVTRSSEDKGDAIDLLEVRKGTLSCTKDEERSWWCVDLGREYALYVTDYTLRHGLDNGMSIIQNWRLEGSLDGRTWTMLKEHEKDHELKGMRTDFPFYTKTWSIDGEISAMRYFRIFQTDKNSSGGYGLYLSGLELYGVLLELKD